MVQQLAKHWITVDEYERMGEAGIFRPDSRLELLEGSIYEMSSIGSRHAACVSFLGNILNRQFGDRFIVRSQDPIRLDDFSEPQPDIAILHWRDDFYRHAHPAPADVLLVIEVADTTVDSDLRIKIPLYAKAGISEAWLINLPAERIETCAEPAGGAYQIIKQIKRGEEARSHAIPELIVSAEAVLG
ncbi:MAG TPA: Uma2 family endonuclease [Pyrinomonadaceae bacterium]|jgi:Uma2 family endonuclease